MVHSLVLFLAISFKGFAPHYAHRELRAAPCRLIRSFYTSFVSAISFKNLPPQSAHTDLLAARCRLIRLYLSFPAIGLKDFTPLLAYRACLLRDVAYFLSSVFL